MAEHPDKTDGTPAETPLVSAAKVIGSTVAKVVSATGLGGDAAAKEQAAKKGKNLYRAEYLGSGTFNITKPKRKKPKRRQAQLKNPQRGARK